MKATWLLLVLASVSTSVQAQNNFQETSAKGKAYIYWGWNRTAYSRSDIHFIGDQYDFTLYDVEATDRPSPFEVKTHLNPVRITIPQTNFRMGYFIKDNIELSVGVDHMKYVMSDDQHLKINGYIRGTETTYDDDYRHENILVSRDFLMFEHTDGLNYINIEAAKHMPIYAYTKWKYKPLVIKAIVGGGSGILLPKTNTRLVGFERYDEFHLAGYGINITAGMQISYKNYFVRGHWKGGYINLPDIRTTQFRSDKAQQHFFYSHANIVFGYLIPLKK